LPAALSLLSMLLPLLLGLSACDGCSDSASEPVDRAEPIDAEAGPTDAGVEVLPEAGPDVGPEAINEQDGPGPDGTVDADSADAGPDQTEVGQEPDGSSDGPPDASSVVSALDEAHTGDLGGVAAADALCTAQAARQAMPGTWKAFLSAAGRHVRDIVPVERRSLPVFNTAGELLLPSWNELGQVAAPDSTTYIYSFAGIRVDDGAVDPDWIDADAWTGSRVDGTFAPGFTCNDWTAAGGSTGLATELDLGGNMFTKQDLNPCARFSAVMCVRVSPGSTP
jgi:hypothetical protein